MVFRGRTVAVFIVLSLLAGSMLTMTALGADGSGIIGKVQTWISGSNANGDGGNDALPATGGAQPSTKQDGLSNQEIKKINKAYQLITQKYLDQVNHIDVVDGAIRGMIEALNDPYSEYINVDEVKQYKESVDSYFTGIGAEVALEDGKVVVVSPIKGSPAEKAGIHARDIILSVNGEKLEGLKLTEAVAKIRGPKGSQARLMILREGYREPVEIIIVRSAIDIETVFATMLEEQIGFIEIRQFSTNTKKRFEQELAALEAQRMKGLIIDVRSNPGGYLEGVLEIIEPLVPAGKALVQLSYRDEQPVKKVSTGLGKSYPIAVLINDGSASASEILASTLRDSTGATLIGETTFGKGTVQTQFEHEFTDGSMMKLTVAKWLTPNGEWIHQTGVKPDLQVSLPDYYRVAPLPRDVTLKLDALGDQVRNLQVLLNGLGFDPKRLDGYFDAQTEEAVKAFQQQQELPETGVVDEATAQQLEEEIIKTIRDPASDLQRQAAIEHLLKRLK